MGYWNTTPDGGSFATDSELVWGDEPADIMDSALAEIIEVFDDAMSRKPTIEELRAGLEFSAAVALESAEVASPEDDQ